MAVLPVNGIPRFAIVDVIGKIWVVAAAVELLPKIAWIGPTPPPVVEVAFIVADVAVIVDENTIWYCLKLIPIYPSIQ